MTTREWLDFSLTLLTVLSWPTVACLALLIFGEPIKCALKRMTKFAAKHGSLEFTLETSDQRAMTPSMSVPRPGQGKEMKSAPPAVVDLVRSYLATIPPEELLDRMQTEGAILVTTYYCERIARFIYESQLRFIHYLAALDSASPEIALRFYDEAKAKFPDHYDSKSFVDWLGFLTDSHLVQRRPDGQLQLTDLGTAFDFHIKNTGTQPLVY